MSIKDYRVDGNSKIKLSDYPTDSKKDKANKEKIVAKTAENVKKISEYQEKLYSEGKEGLIIILQALDAAGKDGTIKHVMSGINPQGVDVISFKAPTSEELAHDFLWRVNKALPTRGKIGLFNRSYYEDVLVVQVHEMNKKYKMADRITGESTEKFFKNRYKQINNYEEYLYENSYRIIKIFLNVSHDEQKRRFLERIDNPDKNWKFSSSDLTERALWDKYQDTFEDVINATSTRECPWYVIPADQKWYTRYLVSEAILSVMKQIDPQFPDMPADEKAKLDEYKSILLKENPEFAKDYEKKAEEEKIKKAEKKDKKQEEKKAEDKKPGKEKSESKKAKEPKQNNKEQDK